MIPYGKQTIDNLDINKVIRALKSKYLTTGPQVEIFENKFLKKVKSKYAVSCSNGTTALHLAFLAADIKENDVVIIPIINFISSINMLTILKAKVYCSDVDKLTGQMTPATLIECIEKNKLKKIKSVVVMYNGGSVKHYNEFYNLKKKFGFILIEDACHALGAYYDKKKYPVGSCKYSDLSAFSFHPVKSITTAEGGMVTTNNYKFFLKMKIIRNHGIIRKKSNLKKYEWSYKIIFPGFNYRLSDLNCSLGISQLNKLDNLIAKRRNIAKFYLNAFRSEDKILLKSYEKNSSYHLFIINFDIDNNKISRNKIIQDLYKKKIITQVHYIPINRHPFYRNKIKGNFCNSLKYYNNCLSLPIFPDLKKKELTRICETLKIILKND